MGRRSETEGTGEGWPGKKAIGSSYCFDQSPGAERYGGVMVTLERRKGMVGKVEVEYSGMSPGESVDREGIDLFSGKAEEGVREAARALGVDLNVLDIRLSRFAIHMVDSGGRVFVEAGWCAFQAAWGAWNARTG